MKNNKLSIKEKSNINVFSDIFCLHHKTGDVLYPIKMRNKDTGVVAFRVSPGGSKGNTKKISIEVEDEHEMKRYVFEYGYSVRASTQDRKRHGLFKVGQRSIVAALER